MRQGLGHCTKQCHASHSIYHGNPIAIYPFEISLNKGFIDKLLTPLYLNKASLTPCWGEIAFGGEQLGFYLSELAWSFWHTLLPDMPDNQKVLQGTRSLESAVRFAHGAPIAIYNKVYQIAWFPFHIESCSRIWRLSKTSHNTSAVYARLRPGKHGSLNSAQGRHAELYATRSTNYNQRCLVTQLFNIVISILK